MKGFAHIGVMKALEERGITPTLYAGTSIGAMLAAARVGGMSPDDLARVNVAFFNVNAIVSIGLLAIGAIAILV